MSGGSPAHVELVRARPVTIVRSAPCRPEGSPRACEAVDHEAAPQRGIGICMSMAARRVSYPARHASGDQPASSNSPSASMTTPLRSLSHRPARSPSLRRCSVTTAVARTRASSSQSEDDGEERQPQLAGREAPHEWHGDTVVRGQADLREEIPDVPSGGIGAGEADDQLAAHEKGRHAESGPAPVRGECAVRSRSSPEGWQPARRRPLPSSQR